MLDVQLLNGACRIDDRGIIRARGADAATFLQGQLTNDVLGLGSGHARLAGFCSAKGRLQASFIVWRPAPDEILLVCAADLLAATLRRLSMFVMRAKCVLSDASGELRLSGLAGASAESLMAEAALPWSVQARGEASVSRLPDAAGVARCLHIAPALASDDLAALPPLSPAAWRWLDVQAGIVTIEAATVDRFVPQMVNYELVGGVDFKKGCYPGQEVVARSQFRGTTKRRTFLFDCSALPQAGQDVYAEDASGEAAGTVAAAAASPLPGPVGSSCLVELRLAALQSVGLRLGSADGPALHRAALPYDVPLEAEAAL